MRFVTAVYGVMRTVYKDTATGLKDRETLGLSNDSGTAGWKKWAKNKADDYYAEWMFDPGSALATWSEKQFKAKMLEFLKSAYRGEYPKFFAGALDHAATRIAAGDFTWENPGNAAATLRDDFATVAEAYRAANAAHLNRELTRLDLKLATDTVGKGVAIYLSGKEALQTDPAKFKKAVLDSIGNVDKAFAAFDTACQTYNGQQWFEVCHQARLAIADVATDASR